MTPPYVPPARLADSVAIVAGSASGIGRAIATHLAGVGAAVMLTDRDGDGLASACSELEAAGAKVAAQTADIGEPEAIASVLAATRHRFGSVDVAVNSVGVTGQTGHPSHEADLDDFDRVVAVNLRGAFVFSHAVLPIMLEQQYGRLLHIASIAGKEGNAGMVAYSASKAGMVGMVKSMGKEYAQDGITVNALAPAVIWTPLVEMLPQHQVDYMTERIPMRRPGTLQEAADMVEFIVSPQASFSTGFTFDLSGGRATY